VRSESWLLEVQTKKMKHITVYVVLPQRTLLLDVAGPLEVLRVANREQLKIRFEVHYVGPEASIVSSIGIILAEIEPLPKTLPNGAMVVLSGDVDYMLMPGLQVAPRKVEDRDAAVVKWLRTVVRPGHKVVSICSGALLAGKAGLLDGIPVRRTTAPARSLRLALRRQKCWRTGCLWRIESATRARV
jgi:transcriptional regulator GlxA family with amidase domain